LQGGGKDGGLIPNPFSDSAAHTVFGQAKGVLRRLEKGLSEGVARLETISKCFAEKTYPGEFFNRLR
jgi:hypothetical protein